MAKEYNVGDRLYLPVWVTEKETNVMMGPDKSTTITDAKFAYVYCLGRNNTGKVRYGEEGFLLTAEEVADKIDLIARATLEEYREGAVRRIQELEVECEKWKATAQNCENSAKAADNAADGLRLENKKLKAENEEWQKTARCYSNNAYSDLELTRKLRADVASLKAERDDLKGATEELKSRNAELEALLKEVMATRDEAIRQNDELIAENKKLKSDCNDWKDTADDRIVDVQNLTAERDNLKADLATQKEVNEELKKKIAELTEWYMEANRTATEAAEANDDLKAKIADLRNRVGEQLAQIQDLNAEVHFLKEKSGKQTEEASKPVHVVTNDGTDIAFNRNAEIMYRTDVDMFVVNDGDKTVAGFLRGDKPGNLAYFWTE